MVLRSLITISIILIALVGSVYSQQYNFNYVNRTKGLESGFVNDVDQGENGFLYIATSGGLGIYDGQKVNFMSGPEYLVDDYVSKILIDKDGIIWMGHIQGGSSIILDGKYGVVHSGDGIDSQINDIVEGPDGKIWFVSQDFGLYYCTKDNDKDIFNDFASNKLLYSLFINSENQLFVGTNEGVELHQFVSDEDGSYISKIQNVFEDAESPIIKLVPFKEDVLAFSQNGQVYRICKMPDGCKTFDIKWLNKTDDILVQNVVVEDSTLYMSTLQQGVIKFNLEGNDALIKEYYNDKSGLATSSVNDVFLDREGVLWMGTFGEGLASKDDDKFTFYFKEELVKNQVTALNATEELLFLGLNNQLIVYDKIKMEATHTYSTNDSLPDDVITTINVLPDSSIVVGTSLNGVWIKEAKNDKFRKVDLSDDYLANTINSIAVKGNALLIATINGLYKYNYETQGVNVFDITSGLPHNSVNYVYVSKKGNTYIATNSAFVSVIDDGFIKNYPIKDGFDVVDINMIVEDDDNNIWLSSNGHGIFQVLDSTCLNINVENGLSNNYCSALSFDNKGNKWIAQSMGLTKVEPGDSVIANYASESGVDVRFNRSAVSVYQNEIWFGTENGVLLFDANKDIKNTIPPLTRITSVRVDNDIFSSDKLIDLGYGTYDITFRLAGLSLKNSQGIRYQFILEGSDEEWSTLTNKSEIYYTRISDGEYTFKVRSFNADGTPGTLAQIKISVHSPFWKQYWFYALCFAIVVVSFAVILRLRERRLRNYQKKLESDLKLRTREVVEQKNKIEEINKDITDSINYAQRIQNSILPQEKYYKTIFPKSFVFFKPRDIVSGDFYWISDHEGYKIAVCADCTGHGVPGGFMSMISHILLRESINPESLENPALILNQMNASIKEVLHQTEDINSSRDGLDLSIIVIKDNVVRFAGAMRPLYVYRDGVCNILKGNRYSVGGIVKNKVFETKEIQVKKGDLLYMFSDGYPDQFGGPNRRKMKVSVLRELMDQAAQLPIEEQKEIFSDFLNSWMNDFGQMDDILLMGIEID